MRTYIQPYRPASPQTADPLLSIIPTPITTSASDIKSTTVTATTTTATNLSPPASPTSTAAKLHQHFANWHIPFFTHNFHSTPKQTKTSPPASPQASSPPKHHHHHLHLHLHSKRMAAPAPAAPPILTQEEINQAKIEGQKVFLTVRNDWAEEIERVLKSEDEDDGEREDDEEERILEAEREGRVVEWCDLESDSETGSALFKNPFRFSSPDELSATRRKRRRSISHAQASEEAWNEGLRNWNRRREVWTGMKRVDEGTWVQAPKCRSRFADNRLTTQIQPQNYPRIYRNLVTAPAPNSSATVPINLSHVVAAMVEGWKADDQWPPKIGPVEPNFAKKRVAEKSADGPSLGLAKTKSGESGKERRSSVEGMVKTVKRVFGSPK